jgi:SAM-dependent methyltransferase
MPTTNDLSSARWAQDRLFTAAWAYDLAFAWDLRAELDVLVHLAGLAHHDHPRVLVPACGTGRYALALAHRGCVVDASDINPAMVSLAEARRRHADVRYVVADMTRPLGEAQKDCDAAFTLCNAFRYVLGDDEIAGHLRAIHARLRPGGRYVIELALNADPREVGQSCTWTVYHPRCQVTATWTLASLDPPTSMELASIRVDTTDGDVFVFREEQPQRLWTARALAEAAAAAGLELAGVHTTAGQLVADPIRPARYYVVLARPAGTEEPRR